jgi:hypothetical protein
MKRLVAAVLLAVMLLSPFAVQSAKAATEPGSFPAFFLGCCFGMRVGSEWNEGKEVHWREWGVLIPVAGFFLALWNGVDCYNGMTSKDFAKQYSTNWY